MHSKQVFNVSRAQHPRNGAWVAFLAYDAIPYSDTSRSWSWVVRYPNDQRWHHPGHSHGDQTERTLDEIRATLVREVLRYCDSSTDEGRLIDLYVEADHEQFQSLAQNWPSLDVAVRRIDSRENPARLIKGISRPGRLNWL